MSFKTFCQNIHQRPKGRWLVTVSIIFVIISVALTCSSWAPAAIYGGLASIYVLINYLIFFSLFIVLLVRTVATESRDGFYYTAFLFLTIISWIAYILLLKSKPDILFLHVFTYAVLILEIISIIFQYHLQRKIHKNKSEGNEKETHDTKLEHCHHFHNSYAKVTLFLVTLMALIFTVYTDVFYQQSNAIIPVLNGLKDNVSVFELDNLRKCDDQINLAFVIDVSGSIDNIYIGNSDKVNLTTNKVKKWFDDENVVTQHSTTDPKGLFFLKLKLCKLIIDNKDEFLSGHRIYSVSLFSFGTDATIEEKPTVVKTEENIKYILKNIMSIQVSKSQRKNTEIENVIAKINDNINMTGKRDVFKRPKTVITILSDFIDDKNYHIKEDFKDLLQGITHKSTFFNLFSANSDSSLQKNLKKDTNILTVLKSLLGTSQYNCQSINEQCDLKTGKFQSGQTFEFLIDNPFFVDSSKTFIKSSYKDEVQFRISNTDTAKDNWQEFKFNGEIITTDAAKLQFNKPDSNFIEYSGHAPAQFSKNVIEFTFQDSKESISSEIIFKKGLPGFIAKILFASCIFIFLISTVYVVYLLDLLCKGFQSTAHRLLKL